MLEHKHLITALWLSKEEKHDRCRTKNQNSEKKVNLVRVSMEDIIYATSLNVKKNYLKIIDKSGIEYYRKLSLRKITEIDQSFIFITKDTVVNTQLVDRRYKWEYLWIKKYKFSVSRSYKEKVEDYFSSVVV